MEQVQYLTQEELDKVASYCYGKQMSFADIKTAFKNGGTVAIGGSTKATGRFAANEIASRVRGMCIARHKGQIPEWYAATRIVKVDE